MRLIKVLGSDVHRRSLNRYNRTEPTPRLGIFVLLHDFLGHMEGDARKVKITKGFLCWWFLFGVAVDIGEFLTSLKGCKVYGGRTKDS